MIPYTPYIHPSIHTYIPPAPILIQILCPLLPRFSPASFPLFFHLTVRPLFDARSFLLSTLIPWVFCSILLCSTHSLDFSVDQSINPSKRKSDPTSSTKIKSHLQHPLYQNQNNLHPYNNGPSFQVSRPGRHSLCRLWLCCSC